MNSLTALRDLFDTGRPMYGGWCSIPSTVTAEAMARAGFDWLCVDQQHGLIGYEAMLPMLQVIGAVGTPTFVRVPWNQPAEVMKALDAGAHGVIVPLVNTRADAERAVAACRYWPAGNRSWGPTLAAMGAPGYLPEPANQAILCCVMVETSEALANLDDILEVEGVDAVFVGPNDLAVSYGMRPGAWHGNQEHNQLVRRIIGACRRRGIVSGLSCRSAAITKHWEAEGVRLLDTHSDLQLLRESAAALLADLRGGRG